MEFGLTLALMNLGIFSLLTILLIVLSVHEKRRTKKEEQGIRLKAGGKEYKRAA